MSRKMRVHTIRLWALGSLNQLFSKASTSAVKIPGFFFLRAKTALIEKDQMHVLEKDQRDLQQGVILCKRH
ncbi:hypothetical protein OUZ56_018528 [Daphnia magna]|uniref:Uncharacterized protein n=1 Tax=Daphnia magna TaxID=35525 RepID=A0ABQ9Z944_9CRUS|nr:hypothetical protein OUZ56_018528 [Daphnia magna]